MLSSELAVERLEAAQISHGRGRGVPGVSYRRKRLHGIDVHSMTVETVHAANILCKPRGNYHTISLGKVLRRQDEAFEDTVFCIASLIGSMIPKGEPVLLVCLGNRNITPDALGPCCAENLMVTRHLKTRHPDLFEGYTSTALICPGVLGTTGIESAALVKGAVEAVQPRCVIAIDALAAQSTKRLATTIQICDTGLDPGAGVGNNRCALHRDSLGVPVIGIGVPTVVDARAFADDSDEQGRGEGLFVTPRDIDSIITHSAKLLGYGINLALHEDLTIGDMELFLG